MRLGDLRPRVWESAFCGCPEEETVPPAPEATALSSLYGREEEQAVGSSGSQAYSHTPWDHVKCASLRSWTSSASRSPPKPAKASLKWSLEIFKNLDHEQDSFCDIDSEAFCCHPLISFRLSGFHDQHSHHLGSFPHLVPNTVAFLREYSVGPRCGPQCLMAKSTFLYEPSYRPLWGH